ncbi:MAG: dienelactone hydrolase family protein [Chloroflexi bacterium]|nr:dienelactone hydrolase family protein [Chloroflexota bacterium]
MVEFESNGARANGYLSIPDSGTGAGVVVIQEWWGLVPHIRNVADRFAREGFVALAPDLYHGKAATEPNEAQKLMMELDIARAGKDMAGAVKYLRSQNSVSPKKVGCVGFCMGGGLTLYLASLGVIDAAVPFYGVLRNQPDWRGVQCPIEGHYAEHDGATDALPKVQDALKQAGKQASFHIYKGTQHAFFNDERPQVYNREAARLSWDRTLAFFRKNLR